MSDADDHVCPECKAEKHVNCDGTTWCFMYDFEVPCNCAGSNHEHLDLLVGREVDSP